MLKPLKIRDKLFNWKEGPFFMGILNVTPDSFSDGGRYLALEKALVQAERLLQEGADIIDVGGESTRPFADPVSEEEELKRVIPVIRELRKNFPQAIISVDTYKAKVAELALKEGADIVNDISALRFDNRMVDVVKDFACPVIIMHMQGTPKTMQVSPTYHDVVKEVKDFLYQRKDYLISQGISEEKIIIDPGIGFGKTFEHNLTLLRNLSSFKELGSPILIGASRKGFIGEIIKKPPYERDAGTAGVTLWCYLQGVNIFRVHNISINKDALAVFKTLQGRKPCLP
ncbi:MAG: dihydropteroate synthase [Thermodesulfobacterium sp.]|nr:dihydropteroate synthase [Thermodesulfobacterium sp.]